MASAILSFSWETQLSRSATVAALKVCLLPLEVKWNLCEPSISGSVASACGDGAVSYGCRQLEALGGAEAYQADDARGSLLVANEKKTFSGLGGPGNVGLGSDKSLLGFEVASESLGLDGLNTEEEEVLGGNQVPLGAPC